jgi:hypothetical protein
LAKPDRHLALPVVHQIVVVDTEEAASQDLAQQLSLDQFARL